MTSKLYKFKKPGLRLAYPVYRLMSASQAYKTDVIAFTGVLKRLVKQEVQIIQPVNGTAMTVQAPNSDVILLVPRGVHGVILGTIHTDHSRFAHLVHQGECIVSPICEFQVINVGDSKQEYLFRLQMPHIIQNLEAARDLMRVQVLKEGQKPYYATNLSSIKHPSELTNTETMLFNVVGKYVEIFSKHFCKILVSAEEVECCKRVNMLVFSQLLSRPKTMASVEVYFTSMHTTIQDYLQVYTALLLFLGFILLLISLALLAVRGGEFRPIQ